MDDDALDELPSDVEAALAVLHADCPAGARPTGCPCFPLHSVYAVVHEPTEVDQELEQLRLSHRVRVLRLMTAHGEEHVVVPAEAYASAMRDGGETEGDAAVAAVLAECTGVRVGRAELRSALGGASSSREGGDAALAALAQRLVDAGWLQASHAGARGFGRDGGGDAAEEAWTWCMPGVGRLLHGLLRCRAEVLRVLWKQKFHRCMRHVVEQTPAVRKALAETRLDLRFVQRDLVGKRLVETTEARGGAILQLTPAGRQAGNHAAASKKRKR